MIRSTRPDTPLADAAEELLRTSSPPVLVAHCLRTHAFATALLGRANRSFDPEVLFVAAALHDLGLSAPGEDGTASFELRGALLAREAVIRAGGEPPAADLVHDAVALHLELDAADDPRPEVAGVHLGAAADVLRLRLDDLPAELVGDVLERWPREGFTEYLVRAMRREAKTRPSSRVAELDREIGFIGLIAAAPFGAHR
ncbi:HD domain-containing protein [Blastococcus haudaquaticus]|uniref:HD domain-containing protein n=1 Tax=Blastococcus haudaquaticus TaxID=1938745 RepID=A0A286GSE8_9ACTN|nr:HD domain-containing protein [Blastococcus haudaquaticus]SOD98440.1 HD domain-containing protein [Blastococcus haudaquaticus]